VTRTPVRNYLLGETFSDCHFDNQVVKF
jgi:hypothetical protein